MTAQCSLHADAVAEITCARCGRFCCTWCIFDRPASICRDCASAVDPYSVRGRKLDVKHGVVTALKLMREEWLAILVVSILFAVPLAVIDHLIELRGGEELRMLVRQFQAQALYDTFVGVVGSATLVALFIARLDGRRLTLLQAFRECAVRWSRLVGTSLRVTFTLLLFFALLIIPGIWKLILLAWTSVAVMRVRGDPLRTSEELVRGRVGPTLGYGLVATLPMALLTGLISTGIENAVEALELPLLAPRIFNSVVTYAIAEGFALAMLTAGFVMVHRDAERPLEPMTWLVSPPPFRDAQSSRST